jgi:hypothetical protein
MAGTAIVPHAWPALVRFPNHEPRTATDRCAIANLPLAPLDEATHSPSEARILNYICDGASRVLFEHLSAPRSMGSGDVHAPALWDERIVPLCAVGAQVASFLWNGSVHDVQALTFNETANLLRSIVNQLNMDARTLVVAIVILESLKVKHDHVLQLFTARPLLIAASIVASKLTCDDEVPTHEYAEALSVHFTALKALHAARLECKLLECLDWQVVIDADVYRHHTLVLLDHGVPADMLPPSLVDVPWLC